MDTPLRLSDAINLSPASCKGRERDRKHQRVGSAVSHGAVVAREFGVPAVVGLRGITQQLETGAWVRLDATAGTLSRCEPEA